MIFLSTLEFFNHAAKSWLPQILLFGESWILNLVFVGTMKCGIREVELVYPFCICLNNCTYIFLIFTLFYVCLMSRTTPEQNFLSQLMPESWEESWEDSFKDAPHADQPSFDAPHADQPSFDHPSASPSPTGSKVDT